MENWETSFIYEDGVNTASKPLEGATVDMISMLSKISLSMFHFPQQHKINGMIYVSYEDGILDMDFDITPTEAIPVLQKAIIESHTRLRDEDRLRLYPPYQAD